MTVNKSIWKKVLQVVITVATAIISALSVSSCVGA